MGRTPRFFPFGAVGGGGLAQRRGLWGWEAEFPPVGVPRPEPLGAPGLGRGGHVVGKGPILAWAQSEQACRAQGQDGRGDGVNIGLPAPSVLPGLDGELSGGCGWQDWF